MNEIQSALPNGVLVVDKPVGPTSHDIVAKARRYFRTKRVGHAGTLDPMASGVLLILLGEATKLSGALTLDRKSYLATITFGTSTDSDDALGKVLTHVELPAGMVTDAALEAALEFERSRIRQLPPIVSAIKQGGMTAHHRLRKGLTVEVQERDVRVFELLLLSRTETTVELSVTVSKGYYVRALARDLGNHLGVPSHLSALRRTASGGFLADEAVPWPPLEAPRLLTLRETVDRCLPCLHLTIEGTERARVGKILTVEHLLNPPDTSPSSLGLCAWIAPNGNIVALGKFDDGELGRVARGFCENVSSEEPSKPPPLTE